MNPDLSDSRNSSNSAKPGVSGLKAVCILLELFVKFCPRVYVHFSGEKIHSSNQIPKGFCDFTEGEEQ